MLTVLVIIIILMGYYSKSWKTSSIDVGDVWRGYPAPSTNATKVGFFCEIGGYLCIPTLRSYTSQIINYCNGASGLPGFYRNGNNLVQRTLKQVLLPGRGVVVELGAQDDFLELEMFHNSVFSAQIVTYQPDPTEYYRLKSKFSRSPRVHVVNEAVIVPDTPSHTSRVTGEGVRISLFPLREDWPQQPRKKPRRSKHVATKTEDSGLSFDKYRDVASVVEHALSISSSGKVLQPEVSAMILNCEGCEYGLISWLTEHPEVLKKITVLIVQFHRQYDVGVANLTVEYCRLRAALSKTHCLLWGFNYVWEAWIESRYCIG